MIVFFNSCVNFIAQVYFKAFERSSTLAIKTPDSSIALTCFNHPEFSRPHRNSLMEGDTRSATAGIKEEEVTISFHVSWILSR